jgi:quercetin dioxygenase-like cupin family protein
MAAKQATLKRKPKIEPTIGSSTYVKPQDMAWKPTQFDKAWVKVLYENKAKGELTCLVKLEPGAHLPMHKHADLEQSFVLEGEIHDHDGQARAGEYVWRTAGSYHENFSTEGAVVLAIYRKLNIFQNSTTGFDSEQTGY